jgi:glycosyltransferase involved in cell wall biosynthesis
MSKTIRVLHTEWSDGWGGQEIRIINEIKAIRSRGVDVFLACKDSSSIKENAIKNNIKVFTLPFKGNGDIKTLFLLKKIIQKYSIDIVNTHSGKDTWVGGLAAKFAGVKFIRTRHLSNSINTSRFNFINELADFIFTTGEKVRDNMIQFNRIKEDRILSIPTGIDCSIFDPEKYKREEIRKQFMFSDDEIVIGVLAVLRKFKRHDLLLSAAKVLIEKYPNKNLVFAIAGEGPQKESIKNIINNLNLKSHVKMIGHTKNAPEFLCAIDILVLSSDSKEGVPQSVIQGLLMNQKVVATDSGSTADLFFDNNFQLVKKDNVRSIIDGISYYLDNSINISSRDYMISYFSLPVMVNKIMDIYNKILN